jgi:hypothetical protein
MFDQADQTIRATHIGAAMRPRRWYTDEVAPPRHALKLTTQLWRCQSLVRTRKAAAVVMIRPSTRWGDTHAGEYKSDRKRGKIP